MIDLRKAALLEALLQLPYQFVMPDVLFNDEWLCLTDTEKAAMCKAGLEVRELPGKDVSTAQGYFNAHAPLTLNDCFALTMAEQIEDCILMSGDGPLRKVAGGNGLEVRGVLWAIDELHCHKVVPAKCLHEALLLFRDDDGVYLPDGETTSRLSRLERDMEPGGADG